MEPAERRRFAVALPVAWLGIAVGMFLYFFDIDSTDDYAGWLVVVVVTQLPAYLAVVTATDDRRLGPGRALAVAIPAGLMIALAMFFVGVVAGLAIWKPAPFEFRPILLGYGAAGVALIVSTVIHVRLLIRQPHRGGARRVVKRVAMVGGLAVLAGMTQWSAGAKDPGIWLAVVAPLLWTLPLWLVVEGPRRIPRAQVRTAA